MQTKILILLAFMSISSISHAENSKAQLDWQVGYADNLNQAPSKWVPATFPGAVQLDIAKAEKYGVYYYAEN